MEKNYPGRRALKVAITGPESTGKTSLAMQLAAHFGVSYIPEYARTYVENLRRSYSWLDLVHIARKQVELEHSYAALASDYLFYDTELIITKVWFEEVYGNCPEWIDGAIRNSYIDLYLLMATDLPWVPDPVRENGGEMREKLFAIYQNNIKFYGFPCKIIAGRDENRLTAALDAIRDFREQKKQEGAVFIGS